MEFNWDDFKKKYSNEQEARQGFALLCEMIMQKHYPDFFAKNSDTIKETENTEDTTLDRKCIIFLPKYFLDGVSNSRKGQIRKALNDNLPYMKANKIEQWVLMMPLEFSPEEKNWWENWSLRIKQENGVTPIALLSSQIVALVAKYGIEFKGVEKIAQEEGTVDFVFEDDIEDDTVVEQVVEPTVETVDVVVNDDETTTTTKTTTTTTITTVTTTEPTTPREPKVTIAPIPNPKLVGAAAAAASNIAETIDPESNQTIAITISDNDSSDDSQEQAETEDDSNDTSNVPEPTLNQLKRSYDFKLKFEDLETKKLALPKDGKNNGQRGVFDRRRDASYVKNYLNDFVFGDLSNFKGKELVKKAQIYVTNEQYSRGLYIYEYAFKKRLVGEDLILDYKKGTDEAEFKLNYKYQMIKGDLLFAQKDFINAADAYEKAKDLKKDFVKKHENTDSNSMESYTYSPLIRDNEASVKYLEAKAEALLHINEYEEAATNFLEALKEDPENKQILNRYELANDLQRWSSWYNNPWLSWLSPLWAPFHYHIFVKKNDGIEDLTITKTIKRRSRIGFIVWALLILIAVGIYFLKGRISMGGDDNGLLTTAQAPSTPLELCISKGDRYMQILSADTPHYIDSAIYMYRRAIRIDNTDTIAVQRYNNAMIEKGNMIAQIQQNISNDSATYFLSMRRPTEGLRLFKYKYDPNDPQKGKFGFVDTLGNIVIPPFFDFNYKSMDEQGETFYNGKAKVCLEVAPNDTVYFFIDQRGNKIDE
ncbi:MAG: hypothetical protein K6F33_07720 [Bacteroidales bacterium]|nr:hypothetical protein [Bacteroidales bacterium]